MLLTEQCWTLQSLGQNLCQASCFRAGNFPVESLGMPLEFWSTESCGFCVMLKASREPNPVVRVVFQLWPNFQLPEPVKPMLSANDHR